jgi:hypothetical protein
MLTLYACMQSVILIVAVLFWPMTNVNGNPLNPALLLVLPWQKLHFTW